MRMVLMIAALLIAGAGGAQGGELPCIVPASGEVQPCQARGAIKFAPGEAIPVVNRMPYMLGGDTPFELVEGPPFGSNGGTPFSAGGKGSALDLLFGGAGRLKAPALDNLPAEPTP